MALLKIYNGKRTNCVDRTLGLTAFSRTDHVKTSHPTPSLKERGIQIQITN